MILEYSQQELRALTALTSADKERLLASDVEAITGLLNRYEEELLAERSGRQSSGILPGMVFTYEEVDRIRNRDLRLIGELMETERNLVEQLGRATVRAEQWEDICKKLQVAP